MTERAAEMRVLVPADFPGDRVNVPVRRHSKRSTIVGCIARDGGVMRCVMIVDRVTMEADLALFGYSGDKVLMVTQQNAFMTTALFDMWVNEVFFPTIERRRQKEGHQGPALLILDGLGSHHSPEFLQECEQRNIYTLFLVRHSSDQTQPLDLVRFSLLKRSFGQYTFDILPTAQSNKIVKIMGAWYQATAPHQVVSAWILMGLVPFRGKDGVGFFGWIEHGRGMSGVGERGRHNLSHLVYQDDGEFDCQMDNKHPIHH
jgi:hypothetical protein